MQKSKTIAPSSPGIKSKRRGRPVKSTTNPLNLKDFTIVEPVHSGKVQHTSEKVLLKPPPQNSVWTLVPKELLESEFFKSQILKVRFAVPSQTVPPADKAPKKERKRPTVIYFKSEKNPPAPPPPPPASEGCAQHQIYKTQNDMAYLLGKYRMLDDEMVANYYEMACGNLKEAERMLSELLAYNPMLSREARVSRSYFRLNVPSHYSVADITSQVSDPPPQSSTVEKDIDVLSRKIIVESLRILLDEEGPIL